MTPDEQLRNAALMALCDLSWCVGFIEETHFAAPASVKRTMATLSDLLGAKPCSDGTFVHDFQGNASCPRCGFEGLTSRPFPASEGDA